MRATGERRPGAGVATGERGESGARAGRDWMCMPLPLSVSGRAVPESAIPVPAEDPARETYRRSSSAFVHRVLKHPQSPEREGEKR